MSPEKDGKLLEADRVVLSAVLDHLIPPVDDLAGAGAMGLGSKVEQRSRRSQVHRGALAAVLDAVSLDTSVHAAGGFLALSEERQDDVLRFIETTIPEQFETFLHLVYTVYYMEPAVLNRVGWPDGPPQPEGFELPPFDESVLDQARKRDPFWRRV